MKTIKGITSFLLAAVIGIFSAACSSSPAGSTSSTANSQASSSVSASSSAATRKTITVGYISDGKPTTYKDESGQAQGLEVEVLKLVAKELPEYKFEFVAGDQSAVLLGVDLGKYQIGLGNFFKTSAREQKYVFPDESVGISLISLIVNKKYQATVSNLADVHNKDLTFVPLPATNANYTMILNWNKDHPDQTVKIGSAAEWNASEAVKWVAEGRYDVMLGPNSVYKSIISQLGLSDKVVVNDPFTYVNSYAIFGNDQAELASKYSAAVKKLKADGTLDQLGEKFYGSDVYHYFDGKTGADQYRWN